jgi:hypothetical protein
VLERPERISSLATKLIENRIDTAIANGDSLALFVPPSVARGSPDGEERSSGGSFISFVFFLTCNYRTQMNECFTKSRHDRLLFTFLFVFIGPIEHCSFENFGGPWRVIATDFQTFTKNKQNI